MMCFVLLIGYIGYMCQGLNSPYFHIIGAYMPIIRIPIKGGMTIPNITTFDHGTYRIYIGLTLNRFVLRCRL